MRYARARAIDGALVTLIDTGGSKITLSSAHDFLVRNDDNLKRAIKANVLASYTILSNDDLADIYKVDVEVEETKPQFFNKKGKQ